MNNTEEYWGKKRNKNRWKRFFPIKIFSAKKKKKKKNGHFGTNSFIHDIWFIYQGFFLRIYRFVFILTYFFWSHSSLFVSTNLNLFILNISIYLSLSISVFEFKFSPNLVIPIASNCADDTQINTLHRYTRTHMHLSLSLSLYIYIYIYIHITEG